MNEMRERRETPIGGGGGSARRLVRQSRKSYGYEDEILMARWVGTEEE